VGVNSRLGCRGLAAVADSLALLAVEGMSWWRGNTHRQGSRVVLSAEERERKGLDRSVLRMDRVLLRSLKRG
jgi:hypothetical protein